MPHLRTALLTRYAHFLETIRGRYDLAERYYRRSLALSPDFLPALGRFALFLEMVRRDYPAADQYYQRALAVAPNDAALLGNYADFLEQALGDLEGAEHHYRRALEVAPTHPNNLTNYATFLMEARGEYDRAEALYRKALEVAPYNRNGLFKYAIFLTDVRQEYGEAEAFYRRGLEVAADNPAMLANFAGLLLLEGKETEGLKALETALHHPALQEPTADAAECWFYALVYRAPDGYAVALQALRRLVETGVRSPGFNLGPHVRRAESQGHPWAHWLERLAEVLTGNEPVEALSDWGEWGAASTGPIH